MGTKVTAIILAAGLGTRMQSQLAKVLHQVGGRPMAAWVVEAVTEAGIRDIIVVVGHQAEKVKTALGQEVRYAYQQQQLGTGHAVLQAEKMVSSATEQVLVLCGDTPLLQGGTIKQVVQQHQETGAAATVLTTRLLDPTGYGRIMRTGSGELERIIEEADADDQQRQVNEVNSGIYCFNKNELFKALHGVTPQNAQGEYYLTDVLAALKQLRHRVEAQLAPESIEVMGINNRIELARAEYQIRQRINHGLMLAGVTMIDPDSTWVDGGVEVGQDTTIYPNTVIEGLTVIGAGNWIGPGVQLRDCRVGEGAQISYTVAHGAEIGDRCIIGPFVFLRPGTRLGSEVKVGDFVELKNVTVGAGSKIPHLSYVGDATIGEHVNIGAGVITCNYDGQQKWTTVIGPEAFIGSNVNLVAPVIIGQGAVVGAGSTVTKDVPAGALAVERNQQVHVEQWASKRENKVAKKE